MVVYTCEQNASTVLTHFVHITQLVRYTLVFAKKKNACCSFWTLGLINNKKGMFTLGLCTSLDYQANGLEYS
jgi:hypothetical protein